MKTPPRVLLHNETTDDLRAALIARFPLAQVKACHTYAELGTTLEAFRPDIVYTVRFDGSAGYPRQALFGAAGPKWICNGGVGTDHFGVWDPKQVTVTNAAGVAADMMAEYILGGFLTYTLDVPGLQSDKANRLWAARTVRPLKGATLLIIGLGHTGRALAIRAKSFGMRVLGTRANPVKTDHIDEVFSPDQLPKLLPRADFIAVATPLTARTRGMLNAASFELMKNGVVLADVSRGGVIDQSALLPALQSKRVAWAILDVFEEEPLSPDNPFWKLDNVMISPHCSSVYDGWEMASFNLFLDNLERWVSARPLLRIVDPLAGY